MDEDRDELNVDTDLRQRNVNDVEAQFDASALALAAAFGVVAFPPGMPDYLQDLILDRAEAIRTADGSFTIESRMKQAESRSHSTDEDADDNLSAWAQIAQQELTAWQSTPSTVGGITMTGAGWADFAKRLKEDDELHRRIIEAFEARGMSETEAEARYKRVTDVAEAASIPPSQRTEQQTELIEKANADPPFKEDMTIANTITNKMPRRDATASADADIKVISTASTLPVAQTPGVGF